MSESDDLERLREQKRKERLQQDPDEQTDEDRPSDAPSEPLHVEDADHFRSVVAEYDVVLVDFYADWCGPCKAIEPVVAELAAETDAAVAKVDVDRHQQLAAQFGVRGVPTLGLFVDGELSERMVGLQDRGRLFDAVRTAIGN